MKEDANKKECDYKDYDPDDEYYKSNNYGSYIFDRIKIKHLRKHKNASPSVAISKYLSLTSTSKIAFSSFTTICGDS